MDLEGRVIQTIQTDTSGRTLFTQPRYVAFSTVNNVIYVSDFDNSSLTCMLQSGSIQWVYKDGQLKGAAGLAIGDGGCIYLCSYRTHAIHVVSQDGVQLAIIPPSVSGVKLPYAVCYSSSQRTLYVSSYNNNYIRRLSLQ